MQFTSLSPEYIEDSVALYETAFPEIERRDSEMWVNLIKNEPLFHPIAIIEDQEFCGFITCWHFEDFIYVEHFAISPDKRGKRLGEKTIHWLIEQNKDKNIVLEVECPNDDISRRRIGFYRRSGLELIEREYMQPPYREGFDFLPLLLMSTQPEKTKKDFDNIKMTIHKVVYGVKS